MINATDSKGTFYKLNQKEGIPIVFIHGVGLDHNIWDPQINEFDNTVLEEIALHIELKNEIRIT